MILILTILTKISKKKFKISFACNDDIFLFARFQKKVLFSLKKKTSTVNFFVLILTFYCYLLNLQYLFKKNEKIILLLTLKVSN
jgi:Ca2+/Na+ antiporter